jgi:hypothetical protein
MYLIRNQAYRKVPWVRIPPSPPGTPSKNAKKPHTQQVCGFFVFQRIKYASNLGERAIRGGDLWL